MIRPDDALTSEIRAFGRQEPAWKFLSPMRDAAAEMDRKIGVPDDISPLLHRHGRAAVAVLVAHRILEWPERHCLDARLWARAVEEAFGNGLWWDEIPSFEPRCHITFLWDLFEGIARASGVEV